MFYCKLDYRKNIWTKIENFKFLLIYFYYKYFSTKKINFIVESQTLYDNYSYDSLKNEM